MRVPKDFLEEPRWILIPVIDVLLAVFLFLAVLAFKGQYVAVFINLPTGKGSELPPKVLNIVVNRQGQIFIGEKSFSPDQLKEFLREKKPSLVNLMAARETPYGVVIKVFNLLRDEGIVNVNLVLKRG